MIVECFKTVIALSAVGGVLTIVILLLKPATEKFFGSVWQYYIWLLVLGAMICPFRLKMPVKFSDKASESLIEVREVIELANVKNIRIPQTQTMSECFSLSFIEITALLWLAVAAVLLVYKIIGYLIFRRTTYKNSSFAFMLGRICVRKTKIISSPLLTGIIKPILLIPKKDLSEKESENIITHELMHYRRGDIVYKWFATIVKCIHWFNPFSYIVARQIDAECEISCDVLITSKMEEEDQKLYMKTVLSLMERNSYKKRLPLAPMANSKSLIKKRFKTIIDAKPLKVYNRVIASIATFIMIFSVFLASAFILSKPVSSKNVLKTSETTNKNVSGKKELQDNNLRQAEQGNIEIVKREEPEQGEQNSTISEDYVSLTEEEISEPEEIIQKQETENIAEEIMSEVLWEQSQEIKYDKRSEESYVSVEVIDLGEKRDTGEMVDVIEKTGQEFVKGDFKFEDGTEKLITNVKPDENGNMTFYFSSEATGEIIEIELWEAESKKSVWGVKVPADEGIAYSFTGLSKDLNYNVSLCSPAKENWKIDSEYIIY